MLWDKKEDKSKLPDLPPLKTSFLPPETEDEDDLEVEKHKLPSFPDSLSSKGFSQSAIKDAVNVEEHSEEPEPESLPEFPSQEISSEGKRFKTIEMKEWSPTPQIEKIRPEKYSVPKKSDIFVKIDKFRSAKKSLFDVKQGLEEIDSILRKIRETKLREEQELESWEREITAAKDKIKSVNEEIFEKVE